LGCIVCSPHPICCVEDLPGVCHYELLHCTRGTFGRDAYPLMRQDACQNLVGSSRPGLAIRYISAPSGYAVPLAPGFLCIIVIHVRSKKHVFLIDKCMQASGEVL